MYMYILLAEHLFPRLTQCTYRSDQIGPDVMYVVHQIMCTTQLVEIILSIHTALLSAACEVCFLLG